MTFGRSLDAVEEAHQFAAYDLVNTQQNVANGFNTEEAAAGRSKYAIVW